jgi:hypothetical protein
MANGHSTDVRLKDNPYVTELGGGYIRNADGQEVRIICHKKPRTAITRFLDKIRVSEILFYNGSPCWEWIGCKSRIGYGQFRIDARRGGSLSNPHRFAHEYFTGPIPEGWEADHLCKVRHCCNPLHLEAVTLQVNRKRRDESKTHCKRNHPLSGDNVRVANNKRYCRACGRQRGREFLARNPGYEKRMQFPSRQKPNNITSGDDAT